jgi:hypothetical protein
MTKEEILEASEIMLRENRKRPPEERFRDMVASGLIDEQGRVFLQRLTEVEDLLRAKGFNDIIAAHKGDVPGIPFGVVCLREIHEPQPRAEGPYDEISELIGGARDKEDLWASLASAGYSKRPRPKSRKKTG